MAEHVRMYPVVHEWCTPQKDGQSFIGQSFWIILVGVGPGYKPTWEKDGTRQIRPPFSSSAGDQDSMFPDVSLGRVIEPPNVGIVRENQFLQITKSMAFRRVYRFRLIATIVLRTPRRGKASQHSCTVPQFGCWMVVCITSQGVSLQRCVNLKVCFLLG